MIKARSATTQVQLRVRSRRDLIFEPREIALAQFVQCSLADRLGRFARKLFATTRSVIVILKLRMIRTDSTRQIDLALLLPCHPNTPTRGKAQRAGAHGLCDVIDAGGDGQHPPSADGMGIEDQCEAVIAVSIAAERPANESEPELPVPGEDLFMHHGKPCKVQLVASKHSLLRNYELAQDSVGIAFAPIGLTRGTRHWAATKQALKEDKGPSPRPKHKPAHVWRAEQETALKKQVEKQAEKETALKRREQAVAACADELAAAGLLLPSGATHDASAMADLCPISMRFVRCRNGVSHVPEEYASAGDMGIVFIAGGCSM